MAGSYARLFFWCFVYYPDWIANGCTCLHPYQSVQGSNFHGSVSAIVIIYILFSLFAFSTYAPDIHEMCKQHTYFFITNSSATKTEQRPLLI